MDALNLGGRFLDLGTGRMVDVVAICGCGGDLWMSCRWRVVEVVCFRLDDGVLGRVFDFVCVCFFVKMLSVYI